MGRGRAKAKQTKVARDLKYQTFGTDLDALQRELHPTSSVDAVDADADAVDEDATADDDPYAAYLTDNEDDVLR